MVQHIPTHRLCSCSLLVAASIMACAPESPPVDLVFVPTFDETPFSCSSPLTDGTVITDLRLFVHDIAFLNAAGEPTPVALVPDERWQSDRVAMLDFEDASGACRSGSTATRSTLRVRGPEDSWSGLQLVLGVPFDLNHADPTMARSPLNLGAMHWGWLAGYKFLRLEGRHPDGEPFRVHWGSTRCEGTMRAVTSCANPNRATLRVEGFDPRTQAIAMDLGALIPPMANTDGSCMGTEDDPDCSPTFEALGIWETTMQSAILRAAP